MAAEITVARESNVNPINAIKKSPKQKTVDTEALDSAINRGNRLSSQTRHWEADRFVAEALGFDDIAKKYGDGIKLYKKNPLNWTYVNNRANEYYSEMLKRINTDFDKVSQEKIRSSLLKSKN